MALRQIYSRIEDEITSVSWAMPYLRVHSKASEVVSWRRGMVVRLASGRQRLGDIAMDRIENASLRRARQYLGYQLMDHQCVN